MNKQQITGLLRRFYAGDQKALEELYRLTGKFAFFHARTMVQQDEEAWKFVETFYTDLYKAQAIPTSEEKVDGWLASWILKEGQKLLAARQGTVSSVHAGNAPTLPEEDKSAIFDDSLIPVLAEALNQLPPLQKTAVWGFYMDGLSFDELADCFGCQRQTVETRLYYAQKGLLTRLRSSVPEQTFPEILNTATIQRGLLALYENTEYPEYISTLALAEIEKKLGFISDEEQMEHLSNNLASEIKTIENQMVSPDAARNELQNTAFTLDEDSQDSEDTDGDDEEDYGRESRNLPHRRRKSSSFKKKIWAAAAAVLVLAGAGGGFAWYQHHTTIVRQQKELASLVEASGGLYGWLSEQKAVLQECPLTEEEKEKLNAFLDQGKQMQESDYKGQITFVQQMADFEATVKTRLDSEETSKLEELTAQDPGYATDEQLSQMSKYSEQAKKLIQNGKYKQFEALAAEWKEYAAQAAAKKTGLDVSVVQYDFSEFPKIRLYLDVRDSGSGESVKNLAPNMFYVSERDAATGDFLRRSVEKAVLMNENEGLNMDLLADTSGSMQNGNMEAAKDVMHHFIDTVQFGAGDRVKLTPFNSDIDKTGYFTSDAGRLNSEISSYAAYGGTKLYDSIIYGVQDVSGQEGAKCVIAFTDGIDEHSYNTAQDVVNVVSRYRIPVFIVRIGDTSTSGADAELRQIAEASGGSFKNMAQFNADMNAFYSQIYRQIKEYYVVEYEVDDAKTILDTRDVSVYVQDGSKGGESEMNIKAGDEFFESLLGSYLRSYITDMNNHHYEQLEQYVDNTVAADNTWSIQWQMKKQVTGGFSNVAEETLMDYEVTSVTVEDENTIHLKANENYDVVYDEVLGDLRKSQRTMAADIISYLNARGYSNLDDSTTVRAWAKVNQKPEYILRKGSDGKWKFSEYAGSLTLDEKRQLYSAEITGSTW